MTEKPFARRAVLYGFNHCEVFSTLVTHIAHLSENYRNFKKMEWHIRTTFLTQVPKFKLIRIKL